MSDEENALHVVLAVLCSELRNLSHSVANGRVEYAYDASIAEHDARVERDAIERSERARIAADIREERHREHMLRIMEMQAWDYYAAALSHLPAAGAAKAADQLLSERRKRFGGPYAQKP